MLISGAPITTPTSLTVKPEASKVEWFAEKVTGQHNGIVSMQSGTIEIEGEKNHRWKFRDGYDFN